MQVNNNWYWCQYPQHHIITVSKRTILHPVLEVNAITYIYDIPKIVSKRTQAKQSISRHPICLTDSDYAHILEEIVCIEKLGLKCMYKFVAMMKKPDMIISNEYYIYFLYIYI